MEPQSASEPTGSFDEAGFDRALEALRLSLKGYIRSLLIDKNAVDDVLQEVCLFLWSRRHEYEGDALRPSAFRVAWFKVLAYRRDRKRERLVHFSDEMLQRVAGAAEGISENHDQRMHALRVCLGKLPQAQLELLNLKYLEGGSLSGHANLKRQSPNSVQKSISRIRLALRHCIESHLPE